MKNTTLSITAVRILVLLIALIGIGAWAWKNFGQQPQPAAETTVQSADHVIVVTYFTSDQRCKTCLKIEELTHNAITQGFADELAQHKIVFQTINFDRPENKHYTKDYALAFKTVVVSERKKGKEINWSKFDKVWQLHSTPDAFIAYLQDGIRKHLTEYPQTPDNTPIRSHKNP